MNGTAENQAPATVADDTRSVSSDNDGERVRERLKKTTIAPSAASSGSRPGSGADMSDQDHVMSSSEDPPRRSRKRSHDESDEDKVDGDDGERARRVKVHERKRSRETTEADRLRAGSGLERVKTPPTHPEESEGIIERVTSPVGRKRSLGKLDKEEEEDQKKKISKTEEDRRKAEESETTKAAEETETTKENSGTKVGCSFVGTDSGHANNAALCRCLKPVASQTPPPSLPSPLPAPGLTSSEAPIRPRYLQTPSSERFQDLLLLRSELWEQRLRRALSEHLEQQRPPRLHLEAQRPPRPGSVQVPLLDLQPVVPLSVVPLSVVLLVRR
jgi:hypothetical protein